MNEPQRPTSREAFNDAADAAAAWRQQQIAALSDTQRQLYEQACRKSEEREDAKAKELERRKQADIEERMCKKLLGQRNLQFNYRGRRTRMTEILARRLIEEHFRPGRPPDHSLFAATLERLERVAAAEIERDHALQLKALKDKECAGLDTTLRRFERGRQGKGQGHQHFARAGTKDKAKTEFKDAAKEAVDRTKSDAIARAIAKVKEKEEDERKRGEHDQGRGRDR